MGRGPRCHQFVHEQGMEPRTWLSWKFKSMDGMCGVKRLLPVHIRLLSLATSRLDIPLYPPRSCHTFHAAVLTRRIRNRTRAYLKLLCKETALLSTSHVSLAVIMREIHRLAGSSSPCPMSKGLVTVHMPPSEGQAILTRAYILPNLVRIRLS